MTNVKFKTKYEGKVFESRNFGNVVVVEYIKTDQVRVKFLDTGFEYTTHMSCIRNGEVKDRSISTSLGVGVIDIPRGCVNKKCVVLWRSMLDRCYNKNQQEMNPSYKDCYVCEDFKQLSTFSDWCESQIGFGNKGWQLDKDILVKGNKVYAPETCCFVPEEINLLLTYRQRKNSDLPIGVDFKKKINKYQAVVSLGKGRRKYLGVYTTPEEAFYAYKQAKEAHIKEVAERWKYQIDPRVYTALISLQINH